MQLPSADQVRRRRKQRDRAKSRREHYLGRIAQHTDPMRKLAEAYDYLRASISNRTPEEIHKVVGDLIATADKYRSTT